MASKRVILMYFKRVWLTTKLFTFLMICLSAAMPVSATTIYQNRDIPLIDNRFRIDHGVEKATFLLYREMGSPAAILVRPDGSKLYAWSLPENVQWLESDELDIVTIESPMPGPWQAIAENRGRNRIRVLSDMQLRVDSIPRKLYEGEWLKVTSELTVQGETLDLGVYLSDALLEVSLESAHHSEDDNFALKTTLLGKFYDDGKDFDEVPDDGTFTTELVFDVPAGQYTFVAKTKNEVFTRAKRQTILVYPPPYYAILMPPEADKDAELVVKVDTDEIEAASLVIDGFVVDSLSWREPFQVRMDGEEKRIFLPTPTVPGHYKLEGDVFATTLDGRDIHLDFPSKSFVILEPVKPILDPFLETDGEGVEPESTSLWIIILIVVLVLAFIGGGVFVFILWRKRRAFAKALAEAVPEDELTIEDPNLSAEQPSAKDPDLTPPKE